MSRAPHARNLKAVPSPATKGAAHEEAPDHPIQVRHKDTGAATLNPTGSVIDESHIAVVRQRQVGLIGKRIRDLRRNKYTLSQLAEVCQLSVGLLSRLENGIGNPSFASLNALARALDVDVYTFFESPDNSLAIVRREDRARIRLPQSKVEVELLVPTLAIALESGLAAALIRLPRNHYDDTWLPTSPTSHDQFELVLEGTVNYHVENEFYELHQGDAIMFDRSRRHRRDNPSPTAPAIIFFISGQIDFT